VGGSETSALRAGKGREGLGRGSCGPIYHHPAKNPQKKPESTRSDYSNSARRHLTSPEKKPTTGGDGTTSISVDGTSRWIRSASLSSGVGDHRQFGGEEEEKVSETEEGPINHKDLKEGNGGGASPSRPCREDHESGSPLRE